MSSFGLGGTNAHIILEEAPDRESAASNPHSHQLLLLSAKDEGALDRAAVQLADWLNKHPEQSLADVAYTLQIGRKEFSERLCLIAENGATATELLQEQASQSVLRGSAQDKAGLTFMFPGGGAQYTNMGLQLYKELSVFREAVDRCLQILEEEHGLHLREVLYPTEESANLPITDPLHAITLLFTIEYATAQLWQSWGLKAEQLIGHSLGEYTAACIAGVFTLKEALGMVACRGALFQKLPKGAMLSVALSETEVQQYLSDEINLATINRPGNCVLSGSEQAIVQLGKELEAMDIQCSRLHISVAAHSYMVEAILPAFKDYLETINFQGPTIPIISNVSGDWADEQAIQTPDYWLQHLRQTVRFADGLKTLFANGDGVLLEVGPGQSLSTFARQHPEKGATQKVLASLRHPKESIHDLAFLLKTAGQLWVHGFSLDWKKVHTGQLMRRTTLPTYPFERQRHWIEAKPIVSEQQATPFPFKEHIQKTTRTRKMNTPTITRVDLVLQRLKEIFHQLSGIPTTEMAAHSSFLEMGFDSLFLTQVTSQLKKQLKVKISFRQLFEEAPNLDALAHLVDALLPESAMQEELAALQSTKEVASSGEVEPPIAIPNYELEELMTSDSEESIEAIVQKQLRLMEQQLQLLSRAQRKTGKTAIPKVETQAKAKPAPKNKPTKHAAASLKANNNGQSNGQASTHSAAHGPWKAINAKQDSSLTEQQQRYFDQLVKEYTERTKGSQQLAQQQRKHLADPRSIVGFSRLCKDMIYQIAVKRSKGSRIWDIDGNEYIDYRMAFGITLFGHSPDFIDEAIRKQLKEGYHLGVNTPLASKVARLLCELSGMDRATLVNTGSEAISAAIRIARTASGKDRVAVFEGDYHGIADEMLVRGVRWDGETKAMPVAPGIPQFNVENVLLLDYDDPNVLDKIKVHADELAAVIIEPIQPGLPQRQPRELLHQIRQLTQTEDIALIFDEMITGFRLAMRGAQEWYGVDADIVAYGKIISGGLPMAAVAGRERFMDCFDGGQWNYNDDSYPEAGVTFFGGTFVKHPLSLAASFAALSEIKRQGPALFSRLNTKTAQFAERLKALFEQTKVPLQIASTASILNIKVVDQNPLSRLFFFYLKWKGIHFLDKAALLSVAHTEEDLAHTYTVIEETIREMQTAGFFPIQVRERAIEHFISYPPDHLASFSSNGQSSKRQLKKNIPLTAGQQEVWVEQQISSEAAAAYNLSSDIQLKGALRIDKLQLALQQLINRHEALRTHFDPGKPAQHIKADLEIDIPFIEISSFPPEQQQQKLELLREAETTIPLDLFSGPLIRASIIRLQPDEHHVLMSVHHGIADGWSCGILARDLGELYTAACEDRAPNLPPAKQLSELVQEQLSTTTATKEAEQYWVDQFKDGVPVLEFPTDRSRPAVKTYSAAFEKLTISSAKLKKLQALAAQNNSTLFVTLYATFSTLLHRLTGQDDFVLGLVAAGQSIAGNEHTVAHGVSLLPLRVQVDATAKFVNFLDAVRTKILDAFDHQQYTLGSLVKALKLKRDPSRQPIISILFNMDADMEVPQFDQLEVGLQPIIRKYETFDIFVNVKVGKEGIEFGWTYNTDLFDAATIQRRLQELEVLIDSIISDPDASLARLDILTTAEKQLLLNEWIDTSQDYPADQCIHHLIEQQTLQTPQAIAVESNDEQLSYQQLNERANQIAHYLHQQGVQQGDMVGIFMERSVDLLVGLLAIIKTGAIYVPLDPANPTDRLRVILEDAASRYLLTHERLMDRLPSGPERIICIEEIKDSLAKLDTTNPTYLTDSSAMAYVIYTSGSTGRPKGVVIPHYAVVDHHLAIMAAQEFTAAHSLLSVASVSFDPSVQDFFMPLFIGGKVVIATQEEVVDGFLLKDRLAKSAIRYMQATPATWRMLLTAGWPGNDAMTVVSVGEGITRPMALALRARCAKLYNAYGPTETTIYSTVRDLTDVADEPETISGYEPVGWPMGNVQIYILDKNMQPVPIGVAGEIYVGGVGVAPNGYLKRPALNKEKFVTNPFSPNPSAKLYRTGDLGRYRTSGDIDFLGRADHQVKVRGYRIELGEIEALLSQYPGIRENIVVVREDKVDDKRLVAYVIMESLHELDVQALRHYLKKQLPEYMIPSAFVPLEAFPLTATLKIDRKKLPVPEYSREELNNSYSAASTETEKQLLAIWSELLNVHPIGVKDNFFDLGGHSLIAVKMMADITQVTGLQLPLSSLLENPTIQGLAYMMDHSNGQYKSKSLVPIKASGSKVPIYLVHGAGLHVLMFETLARYMDAEQPIYALQARGLQGEAPPLDRIEDIAAHYIAEIQKQNPYGPYALAGYSFGGLIAFEMAKQLKAQDLEVVMLGVFDTVVRPHVAGQKQSYYQHLSTLGKKVAWNISLLAKQPLANLKYKSNTLQRRYKRWKWRLTHDEQQELKNTNGHNYEALVDRMNQKAFENYRLQPYDGAIHLFRAKDQRFYVNDFEYLGWQPFAEGGVIVHDVPGDHLNLFNPPNGEAFAEILQACLDEIMSENTNTKVCRENGTVKNDAKS